MHTRLGFDKDLAPQSRVLAAEQSQPSALSTLALHVLSYVSALPL